MGKNISQDSDIIHKLGHFVSEKPLQSNYYKPLPILD